MKWKDIPTSARHYIIYHTMISPFLVVWYMLPVYMFDLGYSVLDAGLIFTVANFSTIPLIYIIGKAFDRIPIKHGLVLIDILDGVENVLYGLAVFLGKSVLVVGMIFGRVARIFYPLYQVSEKILYPKENIEEIFAWHMRLPLVFESIGMIVFGYVFGEVFKRPEHYAVGFISAGAFSIFSVYYILKYIPSMEAEERGEKGFTFRFDREFGSIVFVEILDTLSTELAPNLVLLYYLTEILNMGFFKAMIIMSIAHFFTLPATYVSEKIESNRGFEMISLYFLMKIAWASLMMVPKFFTILLANVIFEFGDTLSFPFYRSWVFSKVPKNRAGEILSAISSLRRLVSLVSPLIAGFLAYLAPTLPYMISIASSGISALTMLFLRTKMRSSSSPRL